jgi:hypothetical protein
VAEQRRTALPSALDKLGTGSFEASISMEDATTESETTMSASTSSKKKSSSGKKKHKEVKKDKSK